MYFFLNNSQMHSERNKSRSWENSTKQWEISETNDLSQQISRSEYMKLILLQWQGVPTSVYQDIMSRFTKCKYKSMKNVYKWCIFVPKKGAIVYLDKILKTEACIFRKNVV